MTVRLAVFLAVATAGFIAGLSIYLTNSATQQQTSSVVTDSYLGETVDIAGQPAELSLVNPPVLINFWATWCPPCKRELPLLDEVATAQNLNVVAVAIDDLPKVQDYLAANDFNMEFLVTGLAPGMKVLTAFGNKSGAMPYTVLVDGNGKILQSKLGSFATLEEIVAFATNR